MKIDKIDIKRGQGFRGSASLYKNIADKNLKRVSQDSGDYIKQCYGMLRNSCKETVEVNVESGRLMDIAESCEPAIFIMNHTANAMRDIKIAKFFNTLLYREYVYNNKSGICPRSKVFANENVLNSQPDGGDTYKWLGVVPVKAKLKGSSRQHNSRIISETVEQLSSGKINLFLFPEGAFCAFPFLPLSWKFQAGVSSIIKKVLEIKDKIKVIPLGFAHKKELSAIHIGDSVDFSKKGDEYSVTEKLGSKVLTHGGSPIKKDEIVPYISGFLVKKLEEVKYNAKADLENSKGEVFNL